jgi:pyruvate kinase
VVRAAVDLARDVGARVIVAYTRQGSSAFRLSKERPRARILALAPTTGVVRRLSLAWGVEAVRIQGGGGTDAILADALARLREDPDVEAGDLAVAVMGGAKDPAGATTLIKLLHL